MFFAEGMEDSETLVTLSLLRKLNKEITTASIEDTLWIRTLDGLKVEADCFFKDVNVDDYDYLIIPGGKFCKPRIPLLNDVVKDTAKYFNDKGKLVAAICHAPTLLNDNGVLVGKEFVCHPSVKDLITVGTYVGPKKAHTYQNVITAEAAGSPVEFTYEIVKYLDGKEVADALITRIRY